MDMTFVICGEDVHVNVYCRRLARVCICHHPAPSEAGSEAWPLPAVNPFSVLSPVRAISASPAAVEILIEALCSRTAPC